MERTAPVFYIPLARRRFLKSLADASAGFTLPGYLAEALTTYPAGGQLVTTGKTVVGPQAGTARYCITIAAFAGYSYELYGNPTLAGLGWAALPFSLTQSGAIDRTLHTATAEGTLNLFVEAKALKGFYCVAFRVPGANVGTP